MRSGILVCAIVMIAVGGCGDSHSRGREDAGDAGGQMDGGTPVERDGDVPDEDGGRPDRDGAVPPDAGMPSEACDTPGVTETVPCGRCGTVERFCAADGTWAYGACTGEGVCEPGTIETVSCGNCGMQTRRCTAACRWETVGECTGEGECTPGTTLTTSSGCPAGQRRELACSDACTFEESRACGPEPCSTPGVIEFVPCGICGRQERFCTDARVWEYGSACLDQGDCLPGTTGRVPCGMCGTRAALCDSSCHWVPALGSLCTGEGECSPGEETYTSMGCPPGEQRYARCDSSCTFTTVEPCRAATPVDVMLLLDVTGSHAMRVADARSTFVDRLVEPLIALGDVAVGVAYYADFPVSTYGSTGDRPFEGGIEPRRVAAEVEAELATSPSMYGNDSPESGIEALSILTGGTPPSSALPLTCSSGRVSGACWRPGALRVIVVYTDAPNHNGPLVSGTGLYSPYSGITPAPATWPDVLADMSAQGVELIALVYTGDSNARAQHARMIADLGQPATNLIDVASTSSLGTALDAVVARIADLGGY